MSRLTILVPLATAAVGLSLTGGSCTPSIAAHVIQMTGNRFTPAEVTVRAGDSLRFVNGRGGLHNVVFREDVLTPAVRTLLDEAMPPREEFRKFPEPPLASPMLIGEGEVHAFALPALPPGTL
jgi:plastocyanin